MTCQGSGSTGAKTSNWLFENWAKTGRRVIPTVYNPANLEQLVAAVLDAEREGGSLKAMGSGWSYSGVAVDDSTTHVINTALLTGVLSGGAVSTSPTELLPFALKDALQSRARYFVEAMAGTKVHVLNCLLDKTTVPNGMGLAMPTLGGSNGQSIAGAVSTGTHGADVNLPPIADCVRAIHLVGPGGQEWWIEADADRSITDPDRMERARQLGLLCQDIRIERNTPLFRSVLVSVGRMGVAYSFVVEAVDAFLLRASSTLSTWTTQQSFLRSTVQVPSASYAGPRFLEILLNPYPEPNGEHTCIVTNRELTPATAPDPETTPAKGPISFFCEMESVTPILVGLQLTLPPIIAAATAAAVASLAPLGLIPIVGPALVSVLTPTVIAAATLALVNLEDAIAALLVATPGGNFAEQLANVCNMAAAAGQKQIVPKIISMVSTTFRDPNAPADTRESFRILTGQGICGTPRVEEPPCQRSINGLEFALDISPGKENLFSFINGVISLTDSFYAQNTPVGFIMSLRFCTKTDAILGMQQFARTCSIEFVMLRGFVGLENFVQRLYQVAESNGAIPHWGLIHELTATQVRTRYPELSTWRQSLQYIIDGGRGKSGTFRSNFSVSRGLEPEAIQPPLVVIENPQTGDADPYDFGTCQLHDRRTVTFHFANTGQGTLRVLGVSVDRDFRDHDIPASSFLGTPGRAHNVELVVTTPSALRNEEIRVTATFVAEESGTHTGTLSIVTNAGNLPGHIIRIPIHAHVESVQLELLQPVPGAPLDVGRGSIGDYKFGTLLVRNSGTKSMLLDEFSLSDPAAIPEVNVERGAIAAGQMRSYLVTFVPTLAAPLDTIVTLHFIEPVSPSVISQDLTFRLTGVGEGAQARLSPPMLDFGTAVIGTQTAPQLVTLQNVGEKVLSITGTLMSNDFRLGAPLPATVAPGAQVPLSVAFRPGNDGQFVTSFSISSDSVQPPTPVILQGIGLRQALLRASPASIEFKAVVPVGGRSAERVVIVRNEGALPVQIGAVTLSGADSADYQIVGTTCAGAALTPEQTCEVRVALAPTSKGRKKAAIDVAFNGPTSPLEVPIAGAADEVQGLVPNVVELSFGELPIGTGGRAMKVSVGNAGKEVANIRSVSIAGANAGDFSIVGDECSGQTLEPGERCTLAFMAQPQGVGTRSADVTITADVLARGIALRADGAAIRMEWSATGLDFGPIALGNRSPRQDAQLLNTGDMTLVVRSINVQGQFEAQDMVPSINTVPPGQAKYFRVWFLPTTAGVQSGSIDVQCDPPGGMFSLVLAGVGAVPR